MTERHSLGWVWRIDKIEVASGKFNAILEFGGPVKASEEHPVRYRTRSAGYAFVGGCGDMFAPLAAQRYEAGDTLDLCFPHFYDRVHKRLVIPFGETIGVAEWVWQSGMQFDPADGDTIVDCPDCAGAGDHGIEEDWTATACKTCKGTGKVTEEFSGE